MGWLKAFITFVLNTYRLEIAEPGIIFGENDFLQLIDVGKEMKPDKVISSIIDETMVQRENKRARKHG